MAVRRKAPVILATVLTLAIAGTALAAARGTTLKMGVLNSLTGNYITSFYSIVGGPAYVFRNGSTLLGSSAIRAWAPYGGTPLELFARTGYPVMRVSNAVKIAYLNADLVDNFSASVANVVNTIPVRDAGGAIAANLNGNASSATNATNADKLDNLDSADLQRRVSGACAAGQSIRQVTEAGAVVCEFDDINGGNAQTLDGIDSTGFVRGNGQILKFSQTLPAGNWGSNFGAGFGHVNYYCPSSLSSSGTVAFVNDTAQTVNFFVDNGGSNPAYRQLTPSGTGTWYNYEPASSGGEWITMSVRHPDGRTVELSVFSVHRTGDCYFQLQGFLAN